MEIADQEEELSGSIVSFNGRNNTKIKSLVANIKPMQEGTGDPSPDNVRPISGWTGSNIYNSVENWCPNDFEIGSASSSGIVPQYPVGRTYAQTYLSSTNRIRGKSLIRLNKNCTYYVSCDFTKYDVTTETFDSDGLSTATVSPHNDWHSQAYSFSGADNVAILVKLKNNGEMSSSDFDAAKVVIKIGSAATEFIPYQPVTTIPINWQSEAGIIYGGTVTLNEDGSADVNGNRILITLDGSSDEDWSSGSWGASAKWLAPSNLYNKIVNPTSTWQPYDAIANYLRPIAQSANWDTNDNYFAHTGQYIYMKCSTIGALNNWRNYLSENPLTILFKLKNPETYHFPNIGKLKAFLGTNNIWSDIGDITVKIAEKGITAFELEPHI